MKRLILPIACGICTVTSDAQTDKQPHPNVIFIYADDLGYTDLSCTGSRFYETPHIDKLAREGVCFTQSYAACPVSSPSRAALLTGKYPARINLTDYIPGDRAYGPHKNQRLASLPFNLHLSKDEITMAEASGRTDILPLWQASGIWPSLPNTILSRMGLILISEEIIRGIPPKDIFRLMVIHN